MNTSIPEITDVRARLCELGHGAVQDLSRDSGVPFTTLWKIRDGTTINPGIETVRKFWPALTAPLPEPEAQSAHWPEPATAGA